MKKRGDIVKSSLLKKLGKDLKVTEKSKKYLEKELYKIRDKEEKLRERIRKERQAIFLSNRAKKLRSSKNK